MLEPHFFMHYAFAVGITFGLLGIMGWLAAHYGQKIRNLPRGKITTDFEVLSRLSLSGQHQLHHIRWNGTDLLIATGPQGATLISSSPAKTKNKPK